MTRELQSWLMLLALLVYQISNQQIPAALQLFAQKFPVLVGQLYGFVVCLCVL